MNFRKPDFKSEKKNKNAFIHLDTRDVVTKNP